VASLYFPLGLVKGLRKKKGEDQNIRGDGKSTWPSERILVGGKDTRLYDKSANLIRAFCQKRQPGRSGDEWDKPTYSDMARASELLMRATTQSIELRGFSRFWCGEKVESQGGTKTEEDEENKKSPPPRPFTLN